MKFLLPAVLALNHIGSSYAFGGISEKSNALLDESGKDPDLSLQDAVQRMQDSQVRPNQVSLFSVVEYPSQTLSRCSLYSLLLIATKTNVSFNHVSLMM